MTSEEEATFVDDLFDRAGKVPEQQERHHATLVLNTLRLGTPLETVLDMLPGVTASDLAAAYTWLEDCVQQAQDAWHNLLEIAEDSPTSEAALKELEAGVRHVRPILPAASTMIIGRKTFVAAGENKTTVVADAVISVEEEMTSLYKSADEIETLISMHGNHDEDQNTLSLGIALYHPYQPCVWRSEVFLPRRVGEVVPAVADRMLSASRH